MRRERGADDDSNDDEHEHEDAERHDQQRCPPSGQQCKDVYPGGSKPSAYARQLTSLLSARALHEQQSPTRRPLGYRPDHETR